MTLSRSRTRTLFCLMTNMVSGFTSTAFVLLIAFGAEEFPFFGGEEFPFFGGIGGMFVSAACLLGAGVMALQFLFSGLDLVRRLFLGLPKAGGRVFKVLSSPRLLEGFMFLTKDAREDLGEALRDIRIDRREMLQEGFPRPYIRFVISWRMACSILPIVWAGAFDVLEALLPGVRALRRILQRLR